MLNDIKRVYDFLADEESKVIFKNYSIYQSKTVLYAIKEK